MPELKARPKLTKSAIDKITPPASGYEIHWCGALRGFGARCTPDGRIIYVAQGRINGKEARIPIGPHGVFTADQAREQAQDLLRAMAKGIDPRAVEKEKKAQGVTLRAVADAYLRDRPLKQSSKDEIERHVSTTFEAWLQKPMSQIDRSMVSKRYADMRDKGLRGKKGAPAQAAQCMSVLKALFNYAIREYRKPDGSAILTDNPCDVLHRKVAPLKPKTTRIPDDKLGEVWHHLNEWHRVAYNRDTASSVALVMFLLSLGLRKMEGAELTWDRVNLDEGWIHLPDPKNRNPVWLPLSTQMVELLKARPRVEGNPFVFPSWGKRGHIVDPRDTMLKVSKVAGIPIALHDLRRTYVTIAVAHCGIDFVKAELLTNHVPKGVTAQHYLETSKLQYLRPETQQISDFIAAQAATYKLEMTA